MGWTNPPTDFVDEYERDHFELVQGTAITFWDRVKVRTPRDEGTAQGNWHMSFATPSDTTWDNTDEHPPQKVKPVPYPVFYVQNNLEYINMLEYGGYGDGPKTVGGFSIQAPAGMFRIVLAELK